MIVMRRRKKGTTYPRSILDLLIARKMLTVESSGLIRWISVFSNSALKKRGSRCQPSILQRRGVILPTKSLETII
jgi:hypothetical protein